MKSLFSLSEILMTIENASKKDSNQQNAEALCQKLRDKLQKIMDEHQKRARVRTLDADAVIRLAEGIERRNSKLPKYLVYGSTYCIQPHAETFRKSYRLYTNLIS